MTALHKPTEEQQAVIEATGRGASNLMIRAYAGCSKTTTLEMAAPQVKSLALSLAFNKKIAVEMAKRLPSNFQTKTMNGLGHGAWAKAIPHVQSIQLDDKKLGKLVSQVAKDRKVPLHSDQWDGLRRLTSGAMQAGIVPEGSGPEGFLPDTRESWQSVADEQLMFEDDFELLWELAREVLEKDIELARQGVISFDDQIFCPTMLGGRFPQFPVLFVDEAQDLSPLNHRMLELSGNANTRLVAVGDERQAIYAFRGADGRSMDSIRRLKPGDSWSDLPLVTTFRCPKAIVARQQGHAPGFRAWPSNVDGLFKLFKVKAQGEAEDLTGEGWTWAEIQAALPQSGASLAILCRNNGPLMAMAFKLIRQGVGVHMLGRELGKGLVTLSKKLCAKDETPVDAVRAVIREWADREAGLARANGKDEKVAGITDRAECLFAVCDGAGVRDAGALRSALEKLFARESGLVTLSSIHRAKGLEWDVVLHLDPWRVPSRWAKQAAKRGDEIQMRQEFNLIYVAETRTRHTLINANLEDFQ